MWILEWKYSPKEKEKVVVDEEKNNNGDYCMLSFYVVNSVYMCTSGTCTVHVRTGTCTVVNDLSN